MKKIILSSVLAGLMISPAIASDGGLYMEDYSSTSRTAARVNTVYYVEAKQPVAPVQPRPCAQKAAAPVSVKTHTEVVDHYQVYQPVTIYQPVGTYTERRVIAAPRPCNRCGY